MRRHIAEFHFCHDRPHDICPQPWHDFGPSPTVTPPTTPSDTDEMFVVAYPSFNPREELSATYQLYQGAAEPTGRCKAANVSVSIELPQHQATTGIRPSDRVFGAA
jgi:hypothetical protein